MRAVILLIFIAFIPTFAALGHDVYLYLEKDDFNVNLDFDEFEFSTLGFAVTEYAPEQHKEVLELIKGDRNVNIMEDPERIAYEEHEQEKLDILNAVLNRKVVELTIVFGVVVSFFVILIQLILSTIKGLTNSKFASKPKKRRNQY